MERTCVFNIKIRQEWFHINRNSLSLIELMEGKRSRAGIVFHNLVCPSVHPSVCPLVGPYVGLLVSQSVYPQFALERLDLYHKPIHI